ncbi:MAG: HD domain-containing protein [Desulfobacterium sp.]|nr:HD domain-containing protein [Desulfobacterium sp.]
MIVYKTTTFKLSALFCGITVVLSVLAGVAFGNHHKMTLINQARENAATHARNLSVNAAAPLLVKDQMQLSVLISTELNNPLVLSAAILDPLGKAVIHSDISNIGAQLLPGGKGRGTQHLYQDYELTEVDPIVIDSKTIGYSMLTFTLSPVIHRINKVKFGLVAAVLVFTSLGCMINVRIIRRLLGPLENLARAAVRVGQGDLTVRVEEAGGEEIQRLGGVFNQMLQGLEQANRQIQEGYLQSVMAFTGAVEAKDPYTRGHCDRVAYYAEKIAREMDMEEERVNLLMLAGQLHDLGKIGVDDAVLCKAGRLTDEEFAHIARHPVIAWQILEPATFLSEVREIIVAHHERFDGTGYPNGLSGDKLSIEARILAVADSYDAMTSNRPYRRHLSEERALSILEEEKGMQFDPEIVDIFLAAQKGFEGRDALDKRLQITSRGRVWVYDGRPPSKETAPCMVEVA